LDRNKEDLEYWHLDTHLTSFGATRCPGSKRKPSIPQGRIEVSEGAPMPYMYILLCNDGTFYTGSTWDLEKRLSEHNAGEGANYTSKRLPVKLIYFEEYSRIEDAFHREKQIQNWSHSKKEALIAGDFEKLMRKSKKDFRK